MLRIYTCPKRWMRWRLPFYIEKRLNTWDVEDVLSPNQFQLYAFVRAVVTILN